MLNKIASTMKKADHMGDTITLMHNGDAKYRTVWGGIISV